MQCSFVLTQCDIAVMSAFTVWLTGLYPKPTWPTGTTAYPKPVDTARPSRAAPLIFAAALPAPACVVRDICGAPVTLPPKPGGLPPPPPPALLCALSFRCRCFTASLAAIIPEPPPMLALLLPGSTAGGLSTPWLSSSSSASSSLPLLSVSSNPPAPPGCKLSAMNRCSRSAHSFRSSSQSRSFRAAEAQATPQIRPRKSYCGEDCLCSYPIPAASPPSPAPAVSARRPSSSPPSAASPGNSLARSATAKRCNRGKVRPKHVNAKEPTVRTGTGRVSGQVRLDQIGRVG